MSFYYHYLRGLRLLLQPRLATKDVLILVFMFVLWGYSLYLTYRAWYKLLYSGGEDSGTNMWRWVAT